MKIGLFGGSGQLGRALQLDLAMLGEVIAPTRQQLDLTDSTAVHHWLVQQRCDLLVNAAAMTKVDVAQTATELSMQLNQHLVQQLATYAAAQQIWLVHFSTDYVFDGSGETPWCETDECQPLQQYGLSKRAGELAIVDSGCLHLVIRTSWLYDSQGQNFLLTMLRLAQQATTPLQVVDDQVGAPTYAPALSGFVCQMIHQLLNLSKHDAKARSGIYHLCAQGHCSWFEFASAIFTAATDLGLLPQRPQVVAVKSRELQRAATRPLNSRLNTGKAQVTFNLPLTNWQQQLHQCLNVLNNSAKTGK